MSKLKEIGAEVYSLLKYTLTEEKVRNKLKEKKVLIPSALAIGSHVIAGFPWNGDWNTILYGTIPWVDNITHFLGAYAVSQIADTLYEPWAEKSERVAKISKGAFVVGSTFLAGGVNELLEKLVTSFNSCALFYEPLPNSIKDMVVNTVGCLANREAYSYAKDKIIEGWANFKEKHTGLLSDYKSKFGY